MKRALSIVILISLCTPVYIALAQLPELPCYYRPTSLDKPWVNAEIPCIEEVVNLPEAGELAFTSLAVSPENDLFAARPLSGQIMRLSDTDGDGLPETVNIYAGNLDRPNSLSYYDGALYAAGRNSLYRITGTAIETLVDAFLSEPLAWSGGVAVGVVGLDDDPRIYVALGSPCDNCNYDTREYGVILSYALDGSDRQRVASGLRQPSDLAIHNRELWVIDSAPPGLVDEPFADELNRVTGGADFGFPTCVGQDHPLIENGCEGKTPPVVAFPTGSQPLGIDFYNLDIIASFQDNILVTMGGTSNQLDLVGYQLAAVRGVDTEQPETRTLIPASGSADPAFAALSPNILNWRGVGFYPARPFDVVINDFGWVYLSLGGGRILALRPQSEVVY